MSNSRAKGLIGILSTEPGDRACAKNG